MAVSAYVDSIAFPTTTGSVVVSPGSLTFDPTGAIFAGNRATADGADVDATWWMGAAASSANELAVGFESEDGSANSDVGSIHANAQCMTGLLANNAVDLVADFTSLNTAPQGFTYNLSNAPAAASILNYLLLGGDVTSIEPCVLNCGTGAGDKSVTGLSGSPSCMIWFAAVAVGTATQAAASINGSPMLGWMCADGTQGYCNTRSTDGQATMNTFRRQRTDKCFGIFGSAGEQCEGHFVSMDANGCTVNLANAPSPNSLRVYGIAIYGGVWKAGSFLSSTGTGTTAVTTTGVVPKVSIFQTYGLAANTTTQDGGKRGMGMCDGTRRWAVAYDDLDAELNSIADSYLDRTRALVSITAGTPTLDDAYDITHDAQGFTYDHEVASGVAIQVIYLVGGDTFVGGGGIMPLVYHHRQRNF